MKYLVTSGCSFSKPGDYTKGTSATPCTWPEWLTHYYKPESFLHLGISSNGQELISRNVIHAVSNLLKEYDAKDFLVGVMWSTEDRKQFYLPNKNNLDYMLSPNPSPSGRHQWPSNDEYGTWHLQNVGFTNKFSQTYYRYFYDTTQSIVNSYEHVLRTQWYLEKHKIKYFMSTINDYTFEGDWENTAQIDYLKELVDWSKFLPAQLPWVIKNTKQFTKEEFFHPNSEQNKIYVDKIIIPFLQEHYKI